MEKRFLIIEHNGDCKPGPSMIVADEAMASNRFDMADTMDGDFTVMYLYDDDKVYPVHLSDEREDCRSEGSIVYATSEMVIEDRHTFGRAVVGTVNHTDH